MANLNKVFLIGRLTRDPELRYTPGGQGICEFGIAVNRTYTGQNNERKEETCFLDLKAWGRRGEIIKQYCTKGSQIFIEGRLEQSTWEAEDGGKRSKLRVVVDNFQFIGGGGGRREGSQEETLDPADFGFGGESRPAPGGSREAEAAADDDLPF